MGKTDMTESTGRTFSCPARRSPRPTAIQTTLYDLIVALSAEVPPDEDDLLTATVVHFMNTHRVTYTGALAGYRLVCDTSQRAARAGQGAEELAPSVDLHEGT